MSETRPANVDFGLIALRMHEVARELRYAATYTPWRPSPQVVLLCRKLCDKLDDDARTLAALNVWLGVDPSKGEGR